MINTAKDKIIGIRNNEENKKEANKIKYESQLKK